MLWASQKNEKWLSLTTSWPLHHPENLVYMKEVKANPQIEISPCGPFILANIVSVYLITSHNLVNKPCSVSTDRHIKFNWHLALPTFVENWKNRNFLKCVDWVLILNQTETNTKTSLNFIFLSRPRPRLVLTLVCKWDQYQNLSWA